MMEVEQDELGHSPAKIKGRGIKRMRYYGNPQSQTIATFDVPARCPEEDAHCTEVRKIKLYVTDRKEVWLHIDDVEWAIRYLYMQHLLKEVPLVPEDSTGPVDVVG